MNQLLHRSENKLKDPVRRNATEATSQQYSDTDRVLAIAWQRGTVLRSSKSAPHSETVARIPKSKECFRIPYY